MGDYSPRKPRKGRRRKPPGLRRPRRFFKQTSKYARIRRDAAPFDLGYADWLTYRHAASPDSDGSFKAKAYLRGFALAKKRHPAPGFPPL